METTEPPPSQDARRTRIAYTVFCVLTLLLTVGYCAFRAANETEKRDKPDDQDQAKIAAMFNLGSNQLFKINEFDYYFARGGSDSFGTCSFTLNSRHLPQWNELLKQWVRHEGYPELDEIRSIMRPVVQKRLERVIHSEFAADRKMVFYTRTVEIYRNSYEEDGDFRAWTRLVKCLAYFEPGDSNNLYVSTDGWLFQGDVFAIFSCNDATSATATR